MGKKKTRADLDDFIDLYLGISKPHFGPRSSEHAARITGQDTHDHPALEKFAESEFDHRVKELAQVAGTIAEIPEFLFFYSNVGSFDAQASANLTKPLVRLDGSLVTFWFLMCSVLVWMRYAQTTAEDHAELRAVAISTLDGYLLERTFPAADEPVFDKWFQRDLHLTSVAMSFSRVIASFVLLHEIFHLSTLPDTSSQALELRVDRLAAQALVQTRARADLEWATVPMGYICAPVVLMDIQRMIRLRGATLGLELRDDKHPCPLQRRRAMERYVKCTEVSDQDLHRDMRFSAGAMMSYLRCRRSDGAGGGT